MKTKKVICSMVLAMFCAFLATIDGWAQVSTSSITGIVLDAQGLAVAGAKVVAKNEATGVAYETRSTSSGDYTLSSLPPGQYTLTVTQQGFKTFASSHNVLTVGAPVVVDATLQLGAVSETVQVESSYERLETSNATVSDVMTTKQVLNLPLNGRNPLSLLTLEPGVVQRTFGGAGSGTHVFGSRDRAHNVTIDGIDANESTVPNPQSNIQRLNPDNVQEFRTVTLGATAENGRNSGANVMVATKSGGNSLHGAAYYFNRNTAFAANEWFNNYTGQARPNLKLHQYGFDVGGPIVRNKMFFFGSFQNNSIKQSAPIASFFGLPTVYTTSMRNGIFRFVRGTVTTPSGKSFSRNDPQLVDANGSLLSGIATCSAANNFQNCVDSYNILTNDPTGIGADPATFGLIKSLPMPNTFSSVGDGLNTGGFSWNPPTKFTGPHYMVRVDHTFGPNDNVFVRWLQNKYDTKDGDFINSRPQVYPGFPPLGEVTRIGKNLVISYRHVFSPSLVNEFAAGFNRFAFAFTFGESNSNFGDPSKLPPWGDECIYGSFDSTLSAAPTNITAPYCVSPHTQRAVTTPQFIDNLSWTHGAHTVRAGFNFRFYIHNDSRGFFGSTILAPGILFSGSNRPGNFTNIPAALKDVNGNVIPFTTPSPSDLSTLQQAIVELAGIPYEIAQSYRADFGANTYQSAQYATVYTRAHQYDLYLQDEWKVRPNLTLNAGVRWEFNPAPYDAKQTLVPNVFPDGSQGPVTFVPADRWFKNNNINSIAPRLGIAWSPDGKTSVRAGYALLFDTLSTFQVTAIAGKVPGFMLGCVTTNDGSGKPTAIGTTSGCATPAGTANRISQGYPLSIPAPITTPSAALTQSAQPSSTAQGVGAFDPNLKNPAVHEWSLTVQRELALHFVAEIGYIGKRGTHLYRAYDLNQGSVSQPGFLDSFNMARANFLAGCNGDGTGCPANVTGQVPTLLLQLVSPAFINSNTSKTDLQRGNIGNFAARMDSLSKTSSQRLALPLNYVRPNAQFGQIFYQDSGGDSYYHGLFIAVRRRFEQGLDVGFSYTFSKSIDDMSVDPTGAATGGGLSSTSFSRTPTDVHNFRLDRSLSDFNNTHVLLANILYDFPVGKGKRFASDIPGWLNQIIGGWSFTGIFNYQSGEPYTISSGARTSNALHNSTALIVGPNIPGGQLQFANGIEGPVLYQTGGFITTPLNNQHLNCQNVTGTQTFFCIPPPGQNGSGRNTAMGPNYWNLDSGLLKNFDLTERFKLQFRAEIFNVLNHPNFENPRNATTGSPTITSSLFGQTCCSTAAVASAQQVNPIGEPMRVIQLGLKLNF
jgi:hypothetical protein